MKFDVILSFYENDEKINFNNIPENIQKTILDLLKTSSKFKNYLEKNISNMGSVCKDKISHYLKLKIKKIKIIKTKSFFGLFGNSVNLEIDANITKTNKKVVGEMWCQKKLSTKEIKELFNEDNVLEHINFSLQELKSGNPYKTFKNKGKKYYFYFN
jgi:hypothetical protein